MVCWKKERDLNSPQVCWAEETGVNELPARISAKSTPARTRPANNSSNRESVSLDDGGFSMGVLLDEPTHLLQLPEHLPWSRWPTDLTSDRK
jgi:hypothetical protein